MPGGIRIRSQLLAALVSSVVLAVAVLAFFVERQTRRALDDALGEQLTSIAETTSTVVAPRIMVLERGDDDARTRRSAMQKLEAIREATGVARILLVRASGDEALLDTARTLRVGDEYGRARFDQVELSAVRSKSSAASVLFEGPDGAPFKTGYAPFYDEERAVVGYIVVNAAATYTAAIDELRTSIGGLALFAVLLVAVLAIVLARRLADPLAELSAAAERVGAGELGTEVPVGGPHETVVLGRTMRAMTASLEAREEEMQMMLAGIAHEVRNPLGGIELFGGLLDEDLEEGDPRKKHVKKILRELGTLSKVVNDFLDFARRRPPEPREVDVNDMLFEVVSIADKDASERSTKLKLEVEGDLKASLDPEAIKRATLNLVRNAIQAAPAEEGLVRISAEREDGLRITIDDNGPGVPPEKRDEIFTPFFTTKQKGTGLGLALVRKSIQEHGGTIEVTDAEGGGARFVIRLPNG
ncbi:MAG: HAMP domain-containing sensor histidine kinase [Deltaproteobacteria bacterium]